MAKIYLSSTYDDLVSFRREVYRTLRQMSHDVISMEDYPASDERPLDKCLQDVRRCDAYVGIFAWRHGYVPRGQSRSITELEYDEAESLGKPCMVFLLDDDAPWSPALMDRDRTAIERLRERLRQEKVVSFFSNADELAREVATAVATVVSRPAPSGVAEEEKRYYAGILDRFVDHLGARIRVYLIACAALIPVGPGLGYMVGRQVPEFLWGSLLFGVLLPLTALGLFPLYYVDTRRKKAVFEALLGELRADAPAAEALAAARHYVDRLQMEVR